MDEIRDRLSTVADPALGDDVVSLGLIGDVESAGRTATVPIALGAPYSPTETEIAGEVREALAAVEEDDAKTRYVAVDSQMVTPTQKFGAPIQFYDGPRDFTTGDFYRQSLLSEYQEGQLVDYRSFQQIPTVNRQAYYESTMVRLYRYHGSSQAPQPVVLDWRDTLETPSGTELLSFDSATSPVQQFSNMTAAREYVANDGTAQVGGFGGIPSEYVEAMEQYRLVGTSGGQSVKIFERVEGATIEGVGPANTTVTASVTMNIETAAASSDASEFTYTQRAQTGADGEFTMTLPYSTTGYDEYGPENGHTNVSVRATGPYEVTTGNTTTEDLRTVKWNGTVDVTEGQVIGVEEDAAEVELERHVVDEPEGAENNTSGSESLAVPSSFDTADASTGDGSVNAGTSGLGPVSMQSPFGAAAAFAVPALVGALARRHA
mgnify:CR=1 FL=1